ncbi:MAG: alkaline phosphatase D family protein [Chloroflexi bacterium]|nr:alkaline phosphatase D family protein [Chloroflexota bacterium]MBI4760298.1 alkaline phosphatase D family protein [Chloroflexota bacterium]
MTILYWRVIGLVLLFCLLGGCASATPAAITSVSALAAEPAHLTHGPVIGAVTPNAARVFVRTDRAAQVQIMYWTDPKLEFALLSAPQTTTPEADWTAQIPLTDLKSSTVYYLNVLVDNVPQSAQPLAQFKTFPPEGSSQEFTFVHLTDSSLIPNLEAKSFANADAAHPDFVILGGDFPHGNPQTLEDKRAIYRKLYDPATSPSISDFVNLILRHYPIAHIWDDHDYGMNNGDKTYPLKPMSFQVLKEYYPLYPVTEYGDWQKFSYAQADFFMLDSRSQRDPNKTPDGPDKSMLDGDNLGAQGQWIWLTEGLRKSTAAWRFILTPVIFNTTTKGLDAWRSFGYEREKLIRFIKDNHIRGVILISGDLHAGGIDNGTHSTFPEMVNNGANGPGCLSTSGTVGKWSEGSYGDNSGVPCNGYGVITVLTNPDRVLLQVKDSFGRTRVQYTVQQ